MPEGTVYILDTGAVFDFFYVDFFFISGIQAVISGIGISVEISGFFLNPAGMSHV
jgi:hypothetical protein